jgi:hypothetical protein
MSKTEHVEDKEFIKFKDSGCINNENTKTGIFI